jgi:hypothetical protein
MFIKGQFPIRKNACIVNGGTVLYCHGIQKAGLPCLAPLERYGPATKIKDIKPKYKMLEFFYHKGHDDLKKREKRGGGGVLFL